MLLKPDCIMCNFKASLAAIRQLTSDEAIVRGLFSEIVEIPALRGQDWNITSPEVFETTWVKISAAFGDGDPFKSMKERQNQKALEIQPWLTSLVNESDDPLYTAANLAAIGNSLDLMWSEGSVAVEPWIRAGLKSPVPRKNFLALKKRLEDGNLLVYLGDNSGEIVFDKLFIDTIKRETDIEIVFVVRSIPTLNDATLTEAKQVRMDESARVIENGIDGPMPGTIIARCSDQVRQLVQDADLIISKGGGNFDSLDEETHIASKICFMLLSKCIPYRKRFNTDLTCPILSVPRSWLDD